MKRSINVVFAIVSLVTVSVVSVAAAGPTAGSATEAHVSRRDMSPNPALAATDFATAGQEKAAAASFDCGLRIPCNYPTAADLGVSITVDGAPVARSLLDRSLRGSWQNVFNAELAGSDSSASAFPVPNPFYTGVARHAVAGVVFRSVLFAEARRNGITASHADVVHLRNSLLASYRHRPDVFAGDQLPTPAQMEGPQYVQALREWIVQNKMTAVIRSRVPNGSMDDARLAWYQGAIGRHGVRVSIAGVTYPSSWYLNALDVMPIAQTVRSASR